MTNQNIKLAKSDKTPWQLELIQAVTDPAELLSLLELDSTLLPQARTAAALFPLKVPRGFLARMEKGNLQDPLLQQILPLGAEAQHIEGFSEDPLGEAAANPIPGLLHKYHGRVLVTLTGACAVNCRFCFRRHFPYADNQPSQKQWALILDYIAADTSISEVIFSGGDPLVMNDTILSNFADQLSQIPHLKRLRIHSRLPIVLPSRITSELTQWLTETRLQPIMVTHCNHPQEINQEVIDAIQILRSSKVTLLNQSVLLKGINDNAKTLVQLSEALFSAGILPYYLHLLDKVQGAAHFDMPLSAAQQLHSQLAQQLSGYCVPKLVYEQSGAPSKLNASFPEFYTG